MGHILVLGGLIISVGIQPPVEPPKPKPLQLTSASRIEALLAARAQSQEEAREVEPAQPTPQPDPEPKPQPHPKPKPKPLPQTQPKVETKPQPKKDSPKPTPAPKPKPKPKPQKRVIRPNLEKVSRQNPLTSKRAERKPAPQPDPNAQFQKNVQNKLQAIRQNLSGTSTIQVPESSGSPLDAERYARWVRDRYENSWTRPDAAQKASATVSVKIVVARDGTIISETISRRSGDPLLDASIERALKLVKRLPGFPDGLQEPQTEFTINFNLKSK